MKQLDELYEACLSGGKIDKKFVINPSMVSLHTVSPFNLWCDFFAPKEEKDPVPESLKILAKIGNIEEEKYVEEKYPGMQRIEVETLEQAFLEVLKGCFEGVMAFHTAPLIYLPEGMLGIADLLERRVGHRSIFGNYHYVIKEKKTTREPKHKHILQTALNNYILGRIQNYTPPGFIILNRDNEEFEFAFDSYATELQDSIVKIKEIMNGKFVTPTKGALQEPWKSFGLKKAKEIGDISLVPGIGPAKKELLAKVRINTISDLEKADVHSVTIKGIGTDSLARWQMHAACISQNKIAVINEPVLVKHDVEIFLDLEGTFDVSNLFLEDLGIESNARWMNVVYLIGVLVVQNGRKKYTPYFADSIEKERAILERFISVLKSHSHFVIYHYGNYEKREMKRMLEKYRIKDSFTDKMVDLSQVLKHTVVFPTCGFGLKEIAKELGFSWSEQGMDGFISIARYLNYLQNGDKAEVQRIIKYNEEDCKATTIVKDFLDSLSR
jgi:uncharacterized protein